jgi:hypothetical protein
VAASRERQHLGYLIGTCLSLSVALVLLSPELDGARAKGPMNHGHEALACAECHRPAPGSARQQIQANLAYAVGRRDAPADFGFKAVSNEDCIACHERANDRHPVFRFLEPRFAEARRDLGVHRCVSCHAEHSGGRVTRDGAFCESCHARFELEHDPAEPTHQALADDGAWQTCLRCHDFHGNHVQPAPRRLEQAAPEGAIEAYLEGGPTPYGEARRFRARRTRP